MKRLILLICVLFISIGLLSIPGYAVTGNTCTEIQYLDDGGYIITTIEESASRATNSKTATKKETQYDSDGSLDWQILLRGTFTYNGTTSVCTASTVTVNIYDTAYSKDSSSATKSGNTAYGSATIKRKVLGVTIATNTYNLTLSCDKDGNLS